MGIVIELRSTCVKLGEKTKKTNENKEKTLNLKSYETYEFVHVYGNFSHYYFYVHYKILIIKVRI